jgi:hypothetical protein
VTLLNERSSWKPIRYLQLPKLKTCEFQIPCHHVDLWFWRRLAHQRENSCSQTLGNMKQFQQWCIV